MKSKHNAEAAPAQAGSSTPGPWTVVNADGCAVYSAHSLICELPGLVEDAASEQQHNARLIADAPDMLAALKAIAAECERQGETDYTYEIGRTARAAIAQAERGDK